MFSKQFMRKSCRAVQRQAQVRGFFSGKSESPVILSGACRTPIGTFGGALSQFSGAELGSIAVKEAVARSGVDSGDISEAFLGNVVAAGMGQAPTRQAIVNAGLGKHIACTTVNKVCSSGMKTAMLGAQTIALGMNDVVVAGGFESMSNIPFYVPKARWGYKYGNGQFLDGIMHDGLTDSFDKHHMGMCAEDCSQEFNIGREAQDQYALESYRRAAAAHEAGRFKDEIIPINIPQRGRDDKVVDTDEEVFALRADKVKGLRPAFTKEGTVTAANASSLNDGAAAMILASESYASANGLKAEFRVLGMADAAHEPIKFPTAPSLAIPKALDHAGISASDVDYYEINEAFSVVSLANNQLLNLEADKVNVNGGAVAMGHPIGCSGARIMVTLMNVLKQNDASIGVAGICNGGGGASAIVIERI